MLRERRARINKKRCSRYFLTNAVGNWKMKLYELFVLTWFDTTCYKLVPEEDDSYAYLLVCMIRSCGLTADCLSPLYSSTLSAKELCLNVLCKVEYL